MHFIGEGLTCDFGEQKVFSAKNFLLSPGQVLQITGRNGSGKTSFLRMVAGLLQKTSGDCYFEGTSKSLCELVHYCGHKESIKENLSLFENLDFWARWLGGQHGDISSLVHKILEVFRLDIFADTPASYLSCGQRKRLSLSRLFTHERVLWVLDEPYSGLDQVSQNFLTNIINDHLVNQGMVMLSTHQLLPFPGAELRMEEMHA